ncbi:MULTISPECIES: hypothetical protein [unclassified Coleofasciculus]|uniref:hypothetical protein n=1 Tax=unclassified Coleofasciculus TaxID=2692782 RepID=UPI00187E8666|nr:MULTISPECIES: hypothetical protein [unclassified Coleofasciculus]MBE9125208.1 hypothetical protein [Coleofasciculus sp. LEGE 07081]MBE9152262.1 hypothetical protein [Coleofasciculus sp. LEGE 07092]
MTSHYQFLEIAYLTEETPNPTFKLFASLSAAKARVVVKIYFPGDWRTIGRDAGLFA